MAENHLKAASMIKLKRDASIDTGGKRMGMGIVARNYEGSVIATFHASKPFITDPITGEALAAWNVAELSLSLGLRKIVIEGDVLIEVVQALRKVGTWRGSYGQAVQSIG